MAAAEPLGPAHAEKGKPSRNPTGKAKSKGSDTTQAPKERGASYLASRIRRDNPDFAAAVERGEYPSRNHATGGARGRWVAMNDPEGDVRLSEEGARR